MKSMKQRTIENALPIVAAAYGRKFGVKVKIGQDMAYTDGKSIVVPNITEDWPHKDALWGYLAHEAAHVRFTDFSVDMGMGTLKHLLNIVEDARIEREMIAIYPGTARSLNEVARYMAAAGHYQIPNDDSPAAFILEGFCLYHLQCRVVGQDAISDILEATRVVFERKFPRGVQVRLHALLRKVPALSNTAEAMHLAREILKMIQEEAEKEREQQQGDQGDSQQAQQGAGGDDPDDSSSQGSGSSDQNDQDDGDDSQAGSGSGQQGDDVNDQDSQAGKGGDDSSQGDDASQQRGAGADDGDGDDANGQQASGDDQGQDGQADSPAGDDAGSQPAGSRGAGAKNAPSGDDAAQVLQQVLAAGEGDHIGDAHQALREELDGVARREGDATYRTVREASDIVSRDAAGNAMRDEVKRTTSRIRTQLQGMVQASQRVARRTVRHGKRVDASRLHRLQSGDTRVFQRNTTKRRPNTAVHLLVDASGSMSRQADCGDRMYQVASKAAMAIGMALEAINGVNPAVTYFGGDGYHPVFSAVRHGERVAPNAGKFTFAPTGTTPMAEALWYSAFELVQTKEERKMLIIVTDGDPDEPEATQAVIDLCTASGVEVIGIGVVSGAIARFVSNHVVIDQVEDLQKTLFRLMEQTLTAELAA